MNIHHRAGTGDDMPSSMLAELGPDKTAEDVRVRGADERG